MLRPSSAMRCIMAMLVIAGLSVALACNGGDPEPGRYSGNSRTGANPGDRAPHRPHRAPADQHTRAHAGPQTHRTANRTAHRDTHSYTARSNQHAGANSTTPYQHPNPDHHPANPYSQSNGYGDGHTTAHPDTDARAYANTHGGPRQ